MKYVLYVLLFTIVLFFTAACKKTTIVSGTITNSATGTPVEGVSVLLVATRSTGPGSEVVSKAETLTDLQGNYSVEVEKKHAESTFLSIKKDGFVTPKVILFERGSHETFDYVLNPYDAWLSITYKNESVNSIRKFYNNYTGVYLEGRIYCSAMLGCGPFLFQTNESRTEIIEIPGGAEITINWDTVKIPGAAQYANRLDTLCPRNDTTFVRIDF